MPSGVRVSAALIVRDEEKFIEGCLASVAGHVDEIVVVDTGSQDATIQIVERFGALLLHRKWRDDFAWARNEALAAATGDWILYIDADERLSLPPGTRLSDGLDIADVIAARVQFRPRPNATPYREYRLFRNTPDIRFRGTMHETIVPDLRRLQATGGRIVDSPAEILHLGYEGDQSAKNVRNIPLLRAALANEPERLYYWHHLIATLDAMGDTDEAIAVAKEAHGRITGADLSPPDRAVAALILTTYARMLYRRGEDVLPIIEQGLELYPTHAQLQLLKAQALIKRDQLDAALVILEDLATIDGATFADPVLSHDRRIFDVFAHDLMGVVLLRLGRRAEAAEAFGRAAKGAPDELSYRVKAAALRQS